MKKRLETLLKLGIFAAIVMYLANKFVESSALLRKLMKTNSGKYYHWKNGSVYYKRLGTGSPLLLIHDLHPFSSGMEWNEVVEELAKTNTVYVLDLPGCGRSNKPYITYVNYFFVQLLNDFVNDVIREKTNVIATGISGSFAVMASHMYPESFGKLTLVNPENPSKLAAVPSKVSRYTKFIMDCPILGTFLYYMLSCENEIEYQLTENYFYNPFLVSSKLLHTYYEAAHMEQGSGRHLLTCLHNNYVNTNINAPFASLSQDIHLIFGEAQPNAQSTAKAYRNLKSDIQVSFISKTKMLPQLEAPAKFLLTCINK